MAALWILLASGVGMSSMAVYGHHSHATLVFPILLALAAVIVWIACGLVEWVEELGTLKAGWGTWGCIILAGMLGLFGGWKTQQLPLSENLMGNHDQGMYTAVAGAIVNHGTVLPKPVVEDLADAGDRQWFAPLFAAEAQRRQNLEVRFRGESGAFFYRDETLQGPLRPRFPIGFSVYLAGLHALGGDWLMLRANLIATALGTLLLGGLAYRLTGVTGAAVAIALWLLQPLVQWSATRLYAEPILMLSWLIALLALTGKGSGWVRGLLAGCFLAGAMVIKVDAIAGVVGGLLVALTGLFVCKQTERKLLVGLSAGIVVGTAWATIILLDTSADYYRETMLALYESHSSLGPGWLMVALLAVFLIGAGWGVYTLIRLKTITDRNVDPVVPLIIKLRTLLNEYDPVLRIAAAALLVATCIYFWLLRPGPETPEMIYYSPMNREIPSLREETFLRLGWYWSQVGLFVALTGSLLLVWRAKTPAAWLFVVTGWAVLLFLAHDIRCLPAQPYSMRRFLPYALPLLTLGCASIAQIGFGKLRPVGAILPLSLALWLALAKPVIPPTPEYPGMSDLLRDISSRINADTMVIVPAGSRFAPLLPALQHLHNIDCTLIEIDRRTPAWADALERLLMTRGASKFITLSASPMESFFGQFQITSRDYIDYRASRQLFQFDHPSPAKSPEVKWRIHILELSPGRGGTDKNPSNLPK